MRIRLYQLENPLSPILHPFSVDIFESIKRILATAKNASTLERKEDI